MAIQPNERLGGTTYTDTGVGAAGAGYAASGAAGSGDAQATEGAGLRDRGRDLAAQAQGKASELVSRYSNEAKSGIEDRKLRAATELNSIANALRRCGTDMNGGEEAMLAPYVEKVADQVSLLSGFLERRSVDEVARDVEVFARRNPAVFLGACFGVGVLAARFLKSSRPPLPAGYVGYGEARYTEPESQYRASPASDTQTPYRASPAADTGIGYDSVTGPNGGGAAYSGAFRGTTASTEPTYRESGSTGGNPERR